MFHDGFCDPACNNRECAHDGGDCSPDEAFEQCAPMQRANRALRSRPANVSFTPRVLGTNSTDASVAIETRLTALQPFTVDLDTRTGGWSMEVGFTLQMRWRDSRYNELPCMRLMPDLLSLRNSDAPLAQRQTYMSAQAEMLWFPRLSIDGATLDLTTVRDATETTQVPRYAISSMAFGFTPGRGPMANVSGAWVGSSAPADGGDYCYDCLRSVVVVPKIKFTTRAPRFVYFPFDVHDFSFTLSVADAELFSCAQLLEPLNLAAMPQSLEAFIGNEWIAQSIRAEHPTHEGGAEEGQGSRNSAACRVVLTVRRNLMIFVVKQILPTTIVVYASVAALYLSAEDHTGDRTAMVLVGALILMVNFQADLGLGSITYLVWWDYFNLAGFFMLLGVLVVCIYEHRLIYAEDITRARAFNRVARVAFLAGIYPLILTSLLVYGQSDGRPDLFVAALVIGVLGVLGVLLVWHCVYRRLLRAAFRSRELAAASLAVADPADGAFATQMEATFAAWDTDRDDKLSRDELRELIKTAFPGIGYLQLREVMHEVEAHADRGDEGSLSREGFAGAMAQVLPKLKKELAAGGLGGAVQQFLNPVSEVFGIGKRMAAAPKPGLPKSANLPDVRQDV